MSPGAALAGLGVLATAIAATLAPAWTYAVSLALFGLPHVATELRYVDQRFGARIGSRLARRLAVPLLVIALVRALAIAGVGDAASRAAVEWTLGAILVVLALPPLVARGAATGTLGALVLVLAIAAVLFEPFAALVLFALLHNATPLGFLAERLRGRARIEALTIGAVVFAVIPAAIGFGIAAAAFEAWGFSSTADGPPRAGALDLHLRAFVPATWHDRSFAVDLFRAAAFLQCMHYAVVIRVLPRLGGGGEAAGSLLRWPSSRRFLAVVAASAAVLLVAFVESFAGARAVYGVVAALHAWVEVPILLLACAAAGVRA